MWDLMALFGRETERERRRAEDWARWVQQRNPFALVSVVLGTFSLIEMGTVPIFSLGGLILGIVALRQLSRPGAAQPHGRRLAWTGVAISGIALIAGTSLYAHSLWLSRSP
jgi:hypothetical protein